MKVRIQLVFEAEDGKPEVIEEVGQLQRGPLRASELGLSLAEAKSLLHGMQQSMVAEQVDQYLGQFKICTLCGAARTKKGQHTVVYRTLFGKRTMKYTPCVGAGGVLGIRGQLFGIAMFQGSKAS
jgi:hypothetical protein